VSELLEKLETLTYSFDSRVKMREIVKAEAIEALEQSEWERVLIERLAVLHILSPEHETNPSKALHDIISYEVLISLDPSVSSDAVALIEKYGGTYPTGRGRDMSDTEQERFYSLAGTVFDRENPIIDGNSYFCCTTPDEAKIAVKMFNTINAKPMAEVSPTVTISRECADYLKDTLNWVEESGIGDWGSLDAKRLSELTKAMEVQGE